MGNIVAICLSKNRGTAKEAVPCGYLEENSGLRGDAHAGKGPRQVSLLSADKIDAFNERGAEVGHGAFGENLVVSGLDLRALPIGTLLRCGEALLELTQIGKQCHNRCGIYRKMGDCIMPQEGVFAKVLNSGEISVGDEITVERARNAAVITLSDKAFNGLREDKSGPAVSDRLRSKGYAVTELVLPDDFDALKDALIRLSEDMDLILTTGGTGFSKRDITPEATLAVATRNAPGIAEAIRAASMDITHRAMLSRAVSVIRGETLIINLPGSPSACIQCMDVFMDVIPHAIGSLHGDVSECAENIRPVI